MQNKQTKDPTETDTTLNNIYLHRPDATDGFTVLFQEQLAFVSSVQALLATERHRKTLIQLQHRSP